MNSKSAGSGTCLTGFKEPGNPLIGEGVSGDDGLANIFFNKFRHTFSGRLFCFTKSITASFVSTEYVSIDKLKSCDRPLRLNAMAVGRKNNTKILIHAYLCLFGVSLQKKNIFPFYNQWSDIHTTIFAYDEIDCRLLGLCQMMSLQTMIDW